MRRALRDLKPSLIRQIHALKKPTSIDCSLGEPTVEIEPELWARGLARFGREPKGYSPNLGLKQLRDLIGRYYDRSGDHVIVTVGSEEALFLAFFTLLDAGDEVIVMDPAYPAYAGLATLCGATLVRVPLKAPAYSLSAADVAKAITPKTRLVVVSSPSNPFGRVDSASEIAALEALCEQHDVHLLSDEIYSELYFGSTPPPHAASAKTIRISGLSKSCAMTGHRLGYLVSAPELVTAMWPVHQLAVTATSTLAQQLAIEAFSDPRFLGAQRELYREAWRQAKAALDMYHIPYIEPEGAFYVMCPVVPSGEDAFEFCKRFLAEHDAVIVPGTAFGPSGAAFVRLSFTASAANFAECVRRLRVFLG